MSQALQIQSEQIDQLITALSKAQGQISHAVKDSINPFFRSKYADLTSVWDACRESLSANGLAVMQSMLPTDTGLLMVTTLGHTSGQWLRSYMPIISSKQDAQSYGSAITYMRRYSLAAIVGITQDDDDGNRAANDKRPDPIIAEPKITPEQVEYLSELVTPDIEDMVSKSLKARKYNNISELLAKEFALFESGIKSLLAKGKS